jgi:hypothetical protein
MKISIFQNVILGIDIVQIYSLCLNEFRKNLASNPERSPLMRSFGYASAGDSPGLFASFPLNLVPFMSHEG